MRNALSKKMNNFKKFRLIHNLSIKELYDFVGLSRRAVQKIEDNNYTWRKNKIIVLESVFGIQRDLLLNENFVFTQEFIEYSATKIAILRAHQYGILNN